MPYALRHPVDENGQTRSFVYDSLSRLISATNPESGTTSYTYDSDGDVLTKTDARNITTTYAYDALNRLTQKSYSDGTPLQYYQYDSSNVWGTPLSNTIGRLVLEGNSSDGKLFSYDSMGRIIYRGECEFAVDCNSQTSQDGFAMQYDLLGGVSQVTYPSGLVVTYTPDGAGRAS